MSVINTNVSALRSTSAPVADCYDLVVIGGGINGVGIAAERFRARGVGGVNRVRVVGIAVVILLVLL